MKIGVISDTHIAELAAGLEFFRRLCSGPFAGVDVILHAGDIVHPDLLHCVTDKPIVGVRGNCDAADPALPEKRICEHSGYRIGLVHGWGGPAGLVANVIDAFAGEQLDAVVFGHSHYPLCRQEGDLLLFNPGSATDRRDAPFHSVGILTLTERLAGQIINLEVAGAPDTTYSGEFL